MKKKHSVLVVDDSPTVRRLVTLSLSQGGYDVTAAENGEEGLEIARSKKPSVILVDFVMPKMNGFEFCKKIRSDSRICNIPIVLITSKGKDVGKGFEENFGISHYLQKPFEPETLMKILNNVLSDDGKKPRSRSDNVSPECTPSVPLQAGGPQTAEKEPSGGISSDAHAHTAVWENISKEFTALLKSAVIQTLKETDLGRPPGRILSGELMYFSVANILKFAAISGISGKLSIFTDSVSGEIYLEGGEVAFASINRPGSRMCFEEILQKDGSSSEAVRLCLEESGGCLLRAGTLLLERGLMTEDALSNYYENLTEGTINESLLATSGHFFLEDVPVPPVIRRVRREKNKQG